MLGNNCKLKNATTKSKAIKTIAQLVMCCVFLLAPNLCLSNVEKKEFRVKLAFIYNFAKFVTWPDSNFSNKTDSIQICLSKYSSFESSIKSYLEKKIGNRSLEFFNINELDTLQYCNLVYFHDDPGANSGVDYSQRGLISIGNFDNFHPQGGVINFFKENNKLRFSINLNSSETVGVSFNSRLLRLAKLEGEV